MKALAGVDLVIEDGEWLAIQCRTGHGKTTPLQMPCGLDRPTSGMIEFDGQDLAALRESQLTHVRATSIGFIFRTFNLVPTLSRPGEWGSRPGPAARRRGPAPRRCAARKAVHRPRARGKTR
ncbi:MAG TPA: ATP-binding cassette domain-containing protein [Streptosporangiaceae bacterium]|nr:ATP-binding cassette domain-containing protein [Streptosporangiaceae bacterium]